MYIVVSTLNYFYTGLIAYKIQIYKQQFTLSSFLTNIYSTSEELQTADFLNTYTSYFSCPLKQLGNTIVFLFVTGPNNRSLNILAVILMSMNLIVPLTQLKTY